MPEIPEKEKAIKQAEKWAGAGKDAFDLACQTAKHNVDGSPLPPATPKNIATTVRAAMKLFLDGQILSKDIKEKLQNAGLDMDNLRQSLVENTVARAINDIINKGDYEALAKLGALAGEEINPIAAGAMPVKYVTVQDVEAVEKHIDEIVPPKLTDGTKD